MVPHRCCSGEKISDAYGVVVPDLPGCFSTGDTLDKAVDNAREAYLALRA